MTSPLLPTDPMVLGSIPNSNNYEGVSNPYSVTDSEQFSGNIVSNALVGSENYYSWKESMKIALGNKYCFVTGTLPKPAVDNPMIHNWERCDMLMFFWILNAVSKEIAESLINLNSAKEAWDDLYNQFHQMDALRILELQDKLRYLKQGSMTLSAYFTKLKTIANELSINCDCCKCGTVTTWKEYQDQVYTLRFLCGLNEKYSSIRSQIFLITPLLYITKAFDIVEKFERQNSLTADTQEAIIFNTSVSRPANPTQHRNCVPVYTIIKGRPQCTHCGLLGHLVTRCFKLHDILSDLEFRV